MVNLKKETQLRMPLYLNVESILQKASDLAEDYNSYCTKKDAYKMAQLLLVFAKELEER